jgi:60 kDa SS-A/Ro ribonucleoprotein
MLEMKNYTQHFAASRQSEPDPLHEMVRNAAGGYVFKINDWKRLRRFLILGSDTNTFYESSKKLTIENAKVVKNLLAENGKAVVDEIVWVSDRGLGIKNDSAIFALAIATIHGNDETRKYAFENLSKVCRIGTHLFQFVSAREALGGGWGKGMRNAITEWYLDKPLQDMIFQVLKYRQREDWSHRDVLRLCHAKGTALQNMVFDAICHKKWEQEGLSSSPHVEGFLAAQGATSEDEVVKIIEKTRIPREFIPTQFLNSPKVWEAMLPGMPITAMVRNLGNMTKIGLIAPLSNASKLVADKLEDSTQLQKSRIHPWSILVAAKVYKSGRGLKGSGEWKAIPRINQALDTAFELSFGYVEPTGKSYLLGVDVSASMGGSYRSTLPTLSPCEAAAAMALITARIESNYYIMGFATEFVDLGISSKDSLTDVIRKTSERNFGGTDTSVAVQWAMRNRVKADVVMIYTDNETWAGDTHTFNAMQAYRKAIGHPVKLGVCGFTATERSVAKQDDMLSMDFVGLSADLPQAINTFVLE